MRRTLPLLGVLLLTSACGDGDMGPPPPPPPPDGLPALADLAPREWHELMPEGETLCVRGGPYSFFVFPGDPRRLMVHFMGGGVCWNDDTCGFDSTVTVTTIEPSRDIVGSPRNRGIIDMNNALNPFSSFTHVFIPACSADLHVGNATVEYSTTIANFRGYQNVRAVLDWVYENIAEVDSIVTIGCSSGGYGQLIWADEIFGRYESAAVKVSLADSSAGVAEDAWFQSVFGQWMPGDAIPQWFDLQPTSSDTLVALYRGVSERHPGATLVQFTSMDDSGQYQFYLFSGGEASIQAWQDGMLANIARLNAEIPGFRYYLSTGFDHCSVLNAAFYSREVGGVLLRDWLGQIVTGVPVESKLCTGCELPVAM